MVDFLPEPIENFEIIRCIEIDQSIEQDDFSLNGFSFWLAKPTTKMSSC